MGRHLFSTIDSIKGFLKREVPYLDILQFMHRFKVSKILPERSFYGQTANQSAEGKASEKSNLQLPAFDVYGIHEFKKPGKRKTVRLHFNSFSNKY